MGHKAKTTFVRPDTDNEPSPCSYEKSRADVLIYNRSPTVIHSFRPANSDLWARGMSICVEPMQALQANLSLNSLENF